MICWILESSWPWSCIDIVELVYASQICTILHFTPDEFKYVTNGTNSRVNKCNRTPNLCGWCCIRFRELCGQFSCERSPNLIVIYSSSNTQGLNIYLLSNPYGPVWAQYQRLPSYSTTKIMFVLETGNGTKWKKEGLEILMKARIRKKLRKLTCGIFRKFNLIKRLKILAALAQAFPFKRKE